MLNFQKYVNFKVCGIESLKYVRVLHTSLLLWRHFHAPKHDAAQNETWLVALPVSLMASWAGLGHSKRPKFPDVQQSAWRSGYARLREYRLDNEQIYIFDNTTRDRVHDINHLWIPGKLGQLSSP